MHFHPLYVLAYSIFNVQVWHLVVVFIVGVEGMRMHLSHHVVVQYNKKKVGACRPTHELLLATTMTYFKFVIFQNLNDFIPKTLF